MTINKSIQIYSFILFMLMSCVLKADDPTGLKPGNKAPNIHASDQFGEIFDLASQLEKGPVVLMFYRGHWCKYCNRQLEALSDSLHFIIDKGATIVTVTPEVMEFVDETSRQYKNSFRIISDTEMKIMDAYKVNFEVKKSTVTKYKFAGINLDNYNGENGNNLPVPATYIINQDGIIDYAYFDINYKKRVSVKTILMNL